MRLIAIPLLGILAFLVFVLAEGFRDKGEIRVTAQSERKERALSVKLEVENLDKSCAISNVNVVIEGYEIGSVVEPPDTRVRDSTFGSRNEFRQSWIEKTSGNVIPPRGRRRYHFTLNLEGTSPVVIEGRINYLGAKIGRRVLPGQINNVYFEIRSE